MAHRGLHQNRNNRPGHTVVSDDESLSDTRSHSDEDDDDDNLYDPEWLDEVSESGDLFYVGASLPKSETNTSSTNDTNSDSNTGNLNDTNSNKKSKKKRIGKLKSLIKYSKGLKNGGSVDLGPREVPGAEDTGVQSLPKVSFQDPQGEVKEVFLDVDPKRHNYGRRAGKCEILFGIIPGRFHHTKSSSTSSRNGSKDDARIMVQGLIPDGEALKSQAIKIGDWLQCVNGVEITLFNIDRILGSIASPTKVKLTLQRLASELQVEEPKCPPQPLHRTRLAKLVASNNGHQQPDSASPYSLMVTDIPHTVLYLTTEGISEFGPSKQDVLYQFPPIDNKLVQVRGMFMTIAHMLPDVAGSTPLSSTLAVDDRLVHVGYAVEGNEVFILALPDECVPLMCLHQLVKGLVRLIRFQYGSLHRAFIQQNESALNHLFTVSLNRLLRNYTDNRGKSLGATKNGGSDSLTAGGKNCPSLLESVPYPHWVSLPSDVQIEIETTLSDFEAAEFVDMSEDYYGIRRLYNILGTALFYKGRMLANHLPKDDLQDAFLYLSQYGLLQLTREESVSQVVVWREVHPSHHIHQSSQSAQQRSLQSDFERDMREEAEGSRYFLMIVGLKHQLLVTILEAGGAASQAKGNPGPDPFYVDQAQATILHLEELHVTRACDTWLSSPNVPALANVEWFLQSNKVNREELRYRDPSPATIRGVPQSVRKSQSELTSILKKKAGQGQQGFNGSSMALCDNESDTSHSMAMSANSSMSDEMNPNNNYGGGARSSLHHGRWSSPSRTSGSDAESRASSEGALYRGEKKSRLMAASSSTLDLNSLYHNLPDSKTIPTLTTGCENVLFHYVQLDSAEGVLVAPHQLDTETMLSAEVFDNFQTSCLMIHDVFKNSISYKETIKNKEVPRMGLDHSLGVVKEHGVLFQCSLPPRPNQKKPSPTLAYWVVGRLFSGITPREIYVCFLDSIPQNVIELAFKIGFGITP